MYVCVAGACSMFLLGVVELWIVVILLVIFFFF